MHAVIRRALETCRDAIQAGGFRLALDLSAAEHHVEADPARLQQLFWNLIKNAAKFTPAGGDDLDPDRAMSRGPLPVATGRLPDRGGLRHRHRHRPRGPPEIFQAFEQGDASITRRFGGLGLGLAISRSVAEAHGGRLTAASDGKDRGPPSPSSCRRGPAQSPSPPARRRLASRPRGPGR